MEVFPSSPVPIYPLSVEQEFRTLKTEMQSGFAENRRQLWTFPRRSMSLKFGPLKDTVVATLWDFYTARKGAYEAFWYFWPLKTEADAYYSYTGEYVTRGDGSDTIFDLPMKSTDSGTLAVYLDGVATQATFLSGGGDAGVDRIQFDATGSITSSSVANPSVITTSADHGLTTGNSVTIAGHSGSTPDINNSYVVTVLSSTTFSIPVDVTVGGTGGTWTIDAPTNGAVITADLTGQLGYRVRFSEDKLNKELFEWVLYDIGLGLQEVRI